MTGRLAGEEITQQGITSACTTLAPLCMSPVTAATRRPRGDLLTKGLAGTMFTTAAAAAPEEALIPMREESDSTLRKYGWEMKSSTLYAPEIWTLGSTHDGVWIC